MLRASRALKLMGPLLEFEDLVEVASDPSQFSGALATLQDRVVALKPGETLVLRGGWHNKDDYSQNILGAVVLVLERDAHNPSACALVVCNSGSGWGATKDDGETPIDSGLECVHTRARAISRAISRACMPTMCSS